MKVAPSMLSADFSKLKEEVIEVTEYGADLIHLDIMDGHFVPNITFGPLVVKALRPYTKIPFDVHLMIENPINYISDFVNAGADIISFHIECKSDIQKTVNAIKKGGVKPAIAIKPGTPIEEIYPYLDDLYMVLIMTVEPGFGGQKFMEDMMDKVKTLKKKKPELLVQVDGGINLDTIKQAADAGVDICVAGTSVFKPKDAKQAILGLKEAAK